MTGEFARKQLGLPNTQIEVDHPMQCNFLRPGRSKSHQASGVAFRNLTVHQGLLNSRGGIKQAKRIRDRHAAFPYALRDRFVRKPKFTDKVLKGIGFFKGIQICALNIFDQRQLEQLLVIGIAENNRDRP